MSIAILVGGCAVNQTPWVPPAELPAKWNAPTAVDGAFVAADWWQEFGDDGLDRLVRRVLASNTDLLIAANRLREARLMAASTSTNLTPDVRLGGSVRWGTESFTMGRMRSRGGDVTATLGYDLDIGGRLAAERDSANLNVKAVESDKEWVRLKIISETLEKYWKLGLLNECMTLAKDRLAYAKRTLAMVQARYEAGSVSKIDVVQAQQNAIAVNTTIERLDKELVENRNALAILLGGPPEAAVDIPGRLVRQSLWPVAAGMPADVIHRRADVREAEWRLRKTLADVDVARASLYPSLTLTGSMGESSASLARFLANPVANAGVAIALPFVEWNRTQLRIRVSQSEFQEAALVFRKTIYVALAQVEDRLTATAQLEREQAQLQEQFEKSRQAVRLAEVRFDAGETDAQPWLRSQQSLREAHEALTQNRFSRLINRAALLVALGGGTENALSKAPDSSRATYSQAS